MLFGRAERLEVEMPQCLLRVARFRGLDRMEFLDNRQFNGNAFTLLASAEPAEPSPMGRDLRERRSRLRSAGRSASPRDQVPVGW